MKTATEDVVWGNNHRVSEGVTVADDHPAVRAFPDKFEGNDDEPSESSDDEPGDDSDESDSDDSEENSGGSDQEPPVEEATSNPGKKRATKKPAAKKGDG